VTKTLFSLLHCLIWSHKNIKQEHYMKTNKNTLKEKTDSLAEGYNIILDKTRESLEELKSGKTTAVLHDAMEIAKQKTVEMGDLTIDEVEKIAEFVRRDVHDAAHFIKTEEREFTDWLRLDLLLLKKKILDNFEFLVDQMRSEILHTSKNVKRSLTWHTGEITGIGTLECNHCHELIHFHKAGHIPPCPKCQKTNFSRRWHK